MFHAEIKLEYDLMNNTCPCVFTPELDLFYFNDPLCLPAHPEVIVVWGRVFGTDTCKSVDTVNCLQDQVEAETQYSMEGVNLKLVKHCSVYLDEGAIPSCDIPTAETVAEKESTASPTPYIVSMVVLGALALLIVIGACIRNMAVFKRALCRKFK